jgi:hypothetical protein
MPELAASRTLKEVTLPNSRNLNESNVRNRFLKSGGDKDQDRRATRNEAASTFRELAEPTELAFARAIEATDHDAGVFAGKLARCLPQVQRHVARTFPESMIRSDQSTFTEAHRSAALTEAKEA